MKKIFYLIKNILMIFFFTISQPVFSQGTNSVKYLKVGDKMPDVEVTNIMNNSFKSAKISDFKGKLVILDFWNSFCSGCIAGFPKLNSLQQQFKDKLQVLLVNPASDHETERSMKIVINRMNSWSDQPFKLPIVYRDTALTKYFEFYGVPYQVWIGPEGNIVAIPDKTALTAENIESVIIGKKVTLKQSIQRKLIPRKVTYEK